MPQISTQEFERLPLRVHDFLAGVRFMMYGPSICLGRTPASRWMNFLDSLPVCPSHGRTATRSPSVGTDSRS
jgi:hypothetical protein